MAEEIDTISTLIKDGKSFLLSGGAGSGKTHSLVELLKAIYEDQPLSRVACITYTNVAVDEIKSRAPYSDLRVSTIHDFMWSLIFSYQGDLKKSLVKLIIENRIGYTGDEALDEVYFSDKEIKYKEWKKLEKGVVSHDEVLLLAEDMFANNKLLADIVKDTYDFIFVDEYQDTADEVIQILLTHLQLSSKTNILGFFGDKMQAIYKSDTTLIQQFIDGSDLQEIEKKDNRRNPKAVIKLINALRTDGLVQQAAQDSNAPNYEQVGNIKFLYSQEPDYDIAAIKRTQYFTDWDFTAVKDNKELYLVKNLIADKAGFPILMGIYDKDQIIAYKERVRKEIRDKGMQIDETKSFGEVIVEVNKAPTPGMQTFIDANTELYESAKGMPYQTIKDVYLDTDQLFGDKKNSEADSSRKDDKRDALINHLFQIQECIELYQTKKYNQFIKKTKFSVMSIKAKRDLNNYIEKLVCMSDETIEAVIDYADEKGIWKKDDKFQEFCETRGYVYARVKSVKYAELMNLYAYVEDHTPYSTQHGIKGAEFNNVLVVLDNGGWNNYNFVYLFENTSGKERVIARTSKLFYVCCSRAKQNLVVYFNKPTASAIEKAKIWFGSENVIDLDA